MKIVASMVTHNELGRYLPIVVPHLLGFCDEIRVLDDLSTDGTYEYLNDVKGVVVAKNRGPRMFLNESDVRNRLLAFTLEGEPDYVLSIDADEFVGSPNSVRMKAREGGRVYSLAMQEVWHATGSHLHIRVDGLWGNRRCPILWRAPRTLSHEWLIPDRKLACGREPMVVRRTTARKSGSDVFHFGWTNELERAERFERYVEHDKGKFHHDRHLQSIMWPAAKVQTKPAVWPAGLQSVRAAILQIACPARS